MDNYTSLIPNNVPVPEPPEMKIIGLFVSLFFCLLFLGFILFIVFEYTMDMTGQAIYNIQAPASVERSQQKKIIAGPTPLEQIASQIHLLSPLPYSAVAEQRIPIICMWKGEKTFPFLTMDLRIDGVLVPWEIQFGNSTWVVNVDLSQGAHRIQTAASDIEILIGNTTDSKWKPMKIHAGVGDIQRCGDCHHWVDRPDELVRQGHGLTLGTWKGNESCTICHSEPDFSQKHSSFALPEESCGNCHLVHGTIEPGKLLKEKK